MFKIFRKRKLTKGDRADIAAHRIVCKLIDYGYVESEPEGLDLEHTISLIIRESFNIPGKPDIHSNSF